MAGGSRAAAVRAGSPAGPPRARCRGDGNTRERIGAKQPIAFFRLGVEHILTGYDHILFLFALILRGGRLGSLLGIVTAFTVAHSITLALAVLGVVVVPSADRRASDRPLDRLCRAREHLSQRAASGRWVVSFVFGLVHGFGFAGALLELGLPPSGIVASLLFFNLGVEAGQAMVVAALFPALFCCRFAWERRAVTAISAVVLVAAVGLLAERTFVQMPPSKGYVRS